MSSIEGFRFEDQELVSHLSSASFFTFGEGWLLDSIPQSSCYTVCTELDCDFSQLQGAFPEWNALFVSAGMFPITLPPLRWLHISSVMGAMCTCLLFHVSVLCVPVSFLPCPVPNNITATTKIASRLLLASDKFLAGNQSVCEMGHVLQDRALLPSWAPPMGGRGWRNTKQHPMEFG